MNESQRQLQSFDNQKTNKDALRKKLCQMQSKLREIEVNIEQERIKNENLKNVQVSEADLRKERDKQETELLNIAYKS